MIICTSDIQTDRTRLLLIKIYIQTKNLSNFQPLQSHIYMGGNTAYTIEAGMSVNC